MRRHAAGAAAILLCAWLLLGPLTSHLEVNADSERDLFRAYAVGHFGELVTSGPAIDYLPLTLGPGWYYATAPALLLNASPVSAHVLHAALVLLGLFFLYRALDRRLGAWPAALTVLAIGTSGWLPSVMVRIWHNAMLPGTALLWVALLLRVVDGETARSRGRALLGGWILLALMLQLHAIAIAFVAIQMGLTVKLVRRDAFEAALPIGGGLLLAAVMLLGYVTVFMGMDWDVALQLRAERMSGRAGLADVFSTVMELLGSGWSSPALAAVGWAVPIAAAVCGVRGGVAWRWLALLALLGGVAAAVLAGLDTAPRYFSVLIPALFVMGAYGWRELLQRINKPSAGPAAMAALTVLALWGGWGAWPVADEGAEHQRLWLTLAEQQTVARELAARWEIDLATVEAQTAGSLFGALSATRYIAFARGDVAKKPSRLARDHVLVLPEGFPGPSSPVGPPIEVSGGSGRSLVLTRFIPPARDTTAFTEAGRCPIRIPYRWSHLTTLELRPFGIRAQPFDQSKCAGAGPLRVQVALTSAQPFHVLVTWFDLKSRYEERAKMSAGNAVIHRYLGEKYEGMALWRVEPRGPGPTELSLDPRSTLATLDIF